MTNKPPITRNELRGWINHYCDAIEEVIAVLGTDLQRDDNGFIVATSDLGIAVRELDHVTGALSRVSFQLVIRGIEAAPPQDITQ
jgi:hypothetical protein